VRVSGIQADVTKIEDIKRFVETVEEDFKGADILINNAGEGSEEKIVDAPDERWQYYWDLFVMSAVRFSRALIPHMRGRGGGLILNNASICALQPLAHEPIYNVTKAALVMFTKCLANEVTKDNIRVNCINPGLIRTPAWEKGAETLGKEKGMSVEEYFDHIAADYTPIGRFASPEEVANLFLFLCSDRASYCLGSTYYVDGGWLNVTT
jgi:NAD(P)-dependent dehydrogenase (short-subunit alcohol dehydrogenase family)